MTEDNSSRLVVPTIDDELPLFGEDDVEAPRAGFVEPAQDPARRGHARVCQAGLHGRRALPRGRDGVALGARRPRP